MAIEPSPYPRGAYTLDELIENMRAELEPLVQAIEAKPATTQNHYGDYMSLIATLAQDRTMRTFIGLAMLRMGGNRQGIKSAMQILGVL